MRNFGVLLTFVCFLIAYGFMYISCRLLLECKKWTKKQDFNTISTHCFGWFGLIAHLAIMTNNLSMCLSFLVIYL